MVFIYLISDKILQVHKKQSYTVSFSIVDLAYHRISSLSVEKWTDWTAILAMRLEPDQFPNPMDKKKPFWFWLFGEEHEPGLLNPLPMPSFSHLFEAEDILTDNSDLPARNPKFPQGLEPGIPCDSFQAP